MTKYVKISYECAKYIEHCIREQAKELDGKASWDLRSDFQLTHNYHEELKLAMEQAK